MRWFFPEVHEQFTSRLAPEERGDVLGAFQKRLFGDDSEAALDAARAWGRYEGSCLFLRPQPQAADEFAADAISLGLGRLEAHYFLHEGFFSEDQLIRNVHRIRHLPAVIVQGRYDMVCPPLSAWRLHQAWPEAKFHMIPDAGHAGLEPGIAAALVAATEQFKRQGRFD
jgi:proline iminopeptidase